jgi:hypothetical protein
VVRRSVHGHRAQAAPVAGAAYAKFGEHRVVDRGAGAGRPAERVGAEVAVQVGGGHAGRGGQVEQRLGRLAHLVTGVQHDPGEVEVDAVECGTEPVDR